MLILSRVCVEFRDPRGTPIFRVTPADRLSLLEAPEAIREDPIFSLLVAERSLEVVTSEKQAKQLEGDPMQDADATGKRKPAKATKKKDAPETGLAADEVTDPAPEAEPEPTPEAAK